MAELTLLQWKWLYFLPQTNGNATEAARLAGYRGNDNVLRVRGAKNMANPAIKEELQKILRKTAMEAEEVLERLTEQARLDISEFFTLKDYGNSKRAEPNFEFIQKYGHLIKSIKYRKDAIYPDIEFHDSQRALELLGRYHSLFKDVQERQGMPDTVVYNQIVVRETKEVKQDEDVIEG